jgi:Na+/melibiose symporter-like transporter
VNQVIAGVAIAALLGFAGYTVFGLIVAIEGGEGHGSVFWTAIGMGVLIAAVALWLSARIYRSRFANRNAKPSY